MTTASLRDKPVRDLARLAKRQGVAGWHAMRKDELIRALVRKARSGKPDSCTPLPARDTIARDAARTAVVAQRIAEARERLARAKNLSTPPEGGRSPRPVRDRMVLMVRGPHWMHAFWEITPRSVERAKAALGQEWHTAKPTLRVLEVESGVRACPSERVIREIEIHGGVKNWFIDVREPLRCRVEIGYRAASGRFHSLTRSNAVSTPAARQGDTLDAHWGDIVDQCEKIYAMSGGFSPENNTTELQELFEERLKRPMSPPSGRGDLPMPEGAAAATAAELQVDAEMLVYGVTQPGMCITLQGEPVKVQADGTFRVRVDMPNKRQVLPIVASSPEGVERQTVVIAVERNTKTMEPVGDDIED
ncbi:MAG: DUF4912 domain-containing protein [Planctomycetia bacterium]